MYNRDLAGTRHSPLAQINRDNVATLREAWTYRLGSHPTAGSISGGSELTPIVVGGLLYATAADRVVALSPETGAEVWRHALTDRSPSRRGVTYWPGEESLAPRLFVTAGSLLLALDARSGTAVAEFGANGVVEMPVRYDAAPTLFENLLVVGSNSPPGSVRAFDARTGAEIWEFRSIPGEGEPGHETWADRGWVDNSGALHWPFSMTVDAERRTLYAVFDSPAPFDYYGGDRLGANLFGNSLVALDVDTGERRWHFQAVHHDIWDYDLPSPPGLLDVTIAGESVPALAIAAKTGYLYLLNRVTGEPLFGIEERPVPASDVPGEQAWLTQPIPRKPPPIARVTFTRDELVPSAEACAELAACSTTPRRRRRARVGAAP